MNTNINAFDQRPTQTDEGIEIVMAHHGDGCPIVQIAGIPHDKITHVPTVTIEGTVYVFESIDEHSGNMIFRQLGYVDRDDPVPTEPLPSEFLDDVNDACDVDGATD